jgi:hypothetical protein
MLESLQMKKDKLIFAMFAALLLSGCEGYQLGGPFADKPAGYKGGSMCKSEKPLELEYAPDEVISIPSCPVNEVDLNDPMLYYEPLTSETEMTGNAVSEVKEEIEVEPIKLKSKEEPWDIDPNDIEGDYPDVVNNKHRRKQIVMINQETRVLAFCRGNKKVKDICVDYLKCYGYIYLNDIPRLPAKYDLAPNKGYPARRWREGEEIPRW